MAENAETERVDEPEKEQETMNQEAIMKIDQETAKLKNQEPLSVKSGQAPEEAGTKDVPPEGHRVVALLRSLPVPQSVSEDAIIVKEILSLAIQFPHVRHLFGHEWANNQVLNPISVHRSYSDDTLQALMVAYVLCISCFANKESKILVHECPCTMPFLVACLRSQTAETSCFAATTMSWLSIEDSNRQKMGEAGAIRPLVELIRQGGDHEVCLPRAVGAIYNLCKVVKNRERAVPEGAVIALTDKIRSRVCVDQMLRALEMLSRHEKAIAELEKNGMFMLKGLFEMLSEEGVTEEDMEYCMTIIHTACGASVAKTRELINGAKNRCETLDRVVSSGTAKAKEIASELLLKLDSAS